MVFYLIRFLMVSYFLGGNMITLEQTKEYTEKLFSTMWVKWIHEGSKPT